MIHKNIWEDLNFPKQSVYVLFLDGTDLYAGAGYDGLWVLDLSRSNAEWEYLGHRVTDGERHFESGVQTIDVFKGLILIGYIDPPLYHDGSRVGIWRSEDRGKSWFPSDSGIRTEKYYYSTTPYLLRSPHNSNLVISAGDNSIFYSTDGGKTWDTQGSEPRGSGILYQGFVWHPVQAQIVWSYYETGFLASLLRKSEDAVVSWTTIFPNIPQDNGFYSMAFNAGDPDIIYVGAQAGVIRSTKGGEEWMGTDTVPALFTGKHGGFFYALQTHPRIPGILYAGAGPQLYGSRTYGETVSVLNTPPELTFILDMWYDENADKLYVAGDGGMFRLHRPVAHIP